MNVAFDHVVVVVPELATAMRCFDAAGFHVVPGGRHDVTPTENALIAFGDSTYLELLAITDEEARESLRVRSTRPGWAAELKRSNAVARRLLPRLVGPQRVADFVLRAERLDRLAGEGRRREFPMTGPVSMSRKRLPGGERLEWQLVLPDSPRLPFFIEDVTPRELRVPGGDSTLHPNGARGIAGVRIAVESVPMAAIEFATLFDAAPCSQPDGTTLLEIAGVDVVLVEGTPEGACGVELMGAGMLPNDISSYGIEGRLISD